MRQSKNDGITLIALVITIIVLLVLAGISISMLTGNNGIITKAGEAAKRTNQSKVDEEEKLNEIEEYINDAIERVDRSNLKIGQYVDYKPTKEWYQTILITSEESGYLEDIPVVPYIPSTSKWQILSINDDGSVDLTVNLDSSNSYVYANGAIGYNNIVYLLNNICNEFFRNDELGITARNMNINDIVKQLNEEGLEVIYTNPYGTPYGETIEFDNAYYPNLYAFENGSGINTTETKKDGITPSDQYYSEPTKEGASQAEKLTVTQNVNYLTIMKEEYFKDPNVFGLIYDGNYNLLSTRGVNEEGGYTQFGVVTLNGMSMGFEGLYYPTGDNNDGGGGGKLKPVVTVSPDIFIGNGEGTFDNPYKLSKD